MLPSRERFATAAQRHGLRVVERHDFGRDYAETLRRWRQVRGCAGTGAGAGLRRGLPAYLASLPVLLRSRLRRGSHRVSYSCWSAADHGAGRLAKSGSRRACLGVPRGLAVALRTGNAGMVDPLWALSLGRSRRCMALAGGAPLSRLLVAIGGGLWGLRLGLHLWRRNAGKPEDARYRKLREDWGDSVQPKLLGLFLLQASSPGLICCVPFPCLRDHSRGSDRAGVYRFMADCRHRGERGR